MNTNENKKKRTDFLQAELTPIMKELFEAVTPIIDKYFLDNSNLALLFTVFDKTQDTQEGTPVASLVAGTTDTLETVAEILMTEMKTAPFFRAASENIMLSQLFKRAASGKDDCDCPNCVARRKREADKQPAPKSTRHDVN